MGADLLVALPFTTGASSLALAAFFGFLAAFLITAFLAVTFATTFAGLATALVLVALAVFVALETALGFEADLGRGEFSILTGVGVGAGGTSLLKFLDCGAVVFGGDD